MSNAEIKNFYLPLAAKQQLKDALRNDCPDPTGSNYTWCSQGTADTAPAQPGTAQLPVFGSVWQTKLKCGL